MRAFVRSLICILIGHLIIMGPALGSGPVKLVILPFQVNSPEDLGYLRKAIPSMLASRVAQGGSIKVVDSSKAAQLGDLSGLDASQAAALGSQLGADFVVMGNITKLGDHVSLDGQLVDVGKGTGSGQLFAEAASMDDVIPQIGRLAQEIRSSMLGQTEQPLPRVQAQAQAPPTVAALPQQQIVPGTADIKYPEPPGGYPAPPGGFTGQDTEEFFVRSDEEALVDPKTSINPSFIMSYEADKARRGYVKSPKLGLNTIQSLDAGDTDGDRLMETVVADDERVYIYEDVMVDDTNRLIIKPQAVWGKVLSLDVDDVNRNGVAEIYITTIQQVPEGAGEGGGIRGEKVTSQVVEYRDGAYRVVAEQIPYFLRVTQSISEGRILLGQEKRPRFQTDRQSDFLYKPFGKIFRLQWEGDELVKGDELPLEDDLCVLGLTMVDVDHDGLDEYLAFDINDYLKLYNAQGGMVWASHEPYGRTANYYLKDFDRVVGPTEEPMDPVRFLPARLVTEDLDGDGFEEVIVNHNYEPLSLSRRLRFFTKGAVFSLSWDGLDFMENWRTREMRGYVSDYQVRDLDMDGTPELLVALVQRSGLGGFYKSQASLISFDLRVDKTRAADSKVQEDIPKLEQGPELELKEKPPEAQQQGESTQVQKKE